MLPKRDGVEGAIFFRNDFFCKKIISEKNCSFGNSLIQIIIFCLFPLLSTSVETNHLIGLRQYFWK
jgi:hypothetical protein